MVCINDLALLGRSAPRHVSLTPSDVRVMVIGDVHGCFDELQELIHRFGNADDVVILAGDLVNKGPKSVDVVRLARARGFHGVLGNHELASLRAHSQRGGGQSPESAPRYSWTDELEEADLEYLRALPSTISLPLHDAIVVHAGLVPGVRLEEQKTLDMVVMRNLIKRESEGGIAGLVAAEKDTDGGQAWASMWTGPQHVYFGHDAKRGLQKHAHATGLDTGCVYGCRLTAALLERGKPARLVSVKAARVYSAPAAKLSSSMSIVTWLRNVCPIAGRWLSNCMLSPR